MSSWSFDSCSSKSKRVKVLGVFVGVKDIFRVNMSYESLENH